MGHLEGKGCRESGFLNTSSTVLEFCVWNVEGLKHVLLHGGSAFFDNFHVLILGETFQLSNVSLPFRCFETLATKQDRGRPSGGLLVAVKPQFSPKLVVKSDCCVAVSTAFGNVIGCYFNPAWKIEDIVDELVACFSEIDLSLPTLACGDFNARIDDQSDKGSDLCDFFRDFGFECLNDPEVSTYICHNGKSTIDLIFLNSPFDNITVKVGGSLLRKHLPVHVSVQGNFSSKAKSNIVPKGLRRKIVPNCLDDTKITRIRELLNDPSNMDQAYSLLCDVIKMAVPEHAPPRMNGKCDADKILTTLKNESLDLMMLRDLPGFDTLFHSKRQEYKKFLVCKKKDEMEVREAEILRSAEKFPWKLNSRYKPSFSPIPLENWGPHFSELLNPSNSDKENEVECDASWLDDTDDNVLSEPFTELELTCCLASSKNNKAVGSDKIANEHIKGSFAELNVVWLLIFNMILFRGIIVNRWRESIVMVLYKGKGSIIDTNSYRGIALLSHPFKLFTKLLTDRLYLFLEDKMPNNQFGFMKGKSTKHAINYLRNAIKNRLATPRTPLYAIFVDFSKAFDSVRRDLLLKKFATELNVRGRFLRVLKNILNFNVIKVFNGIDTGDEIIQTQGVLQGDSLSPLLFIAFLYDLPEFIKSRAPVEVLLYADDLVIYSENREQLQLAIDALVEYCDINVLKVNLSKTKVLKFRRGGRLKHDDQFMFGDKIVHFCNEYEYLGLIMQPTGTVTRHVRKRCLKASIAMCIVKNLSMLSLNGALRYFEVMIKPIVLYGIDIVWEDLKVSDFLRLDAVKWNFLKRVLGVHRSTRNRLIALITGVPSLTESVVKKGLPVTVAYDSYLKDCESKFTDVDPDIFKTCAFSNSVWKNPCYVKRSVVMRASVHGFHHLICNKGFCFERELDCVCFHCDNSAASILHAIDCPVIPSLSFLSTLE